ncbi:SIR2 family protein [Methanobacterium formicicum]|uniref:Uncharacterized protein n=1 Tax=Methanobacterium formicicum TaxID=2162 RepID=A0A090I4L2_METFO|nr:SIR2 family protein [Methanobacterium formicicum]MDH2659703.1 SIR2 family protein [Methanobacterium formicicum]CEA12735.1 hypothetical protein DSM1535_0372 [Methanobacterium formicicum]
MAELTHDPSEYIRQLQQLLISDKKRIGFLFGAGTSLARKKDDHPYIPAIGELTEIIEAELTQYEDAINQIKDEIGEANYNIETLLTNLEKKKDVIFGDTEINGLNLDDISDLITLIKTEIRKNVSIHEKLMENEIYLENSIHSDFTEWINRADRKYGIEIFTLNYDYLFELGLELKNVPYYDGFTGSFMPFFNSDSVEDFEFLPRQTKLWKIHGSLGWHHDKRSGKVLRKDSSENDILIYPSTLKYSDSKKQPYISFLDRLSNFLRRDDSILITCGYSFGDEHINERIVTALNSNSSSHVFSLYYDIINQDGNKDFILKNNSNLVKMAKKNSKLSIYGIRNAVIGCQYGIWELKTESEQTDFLNKYFKQWDELDSDENEIKMKEGEFLLPDFSNFVSFLSSLIIDNNLE